MEMMGWAMSGTNIKLIREADGIGNESLRLGSRDGKAHPTRKIGRQCRRQAAPGAMRVGAVDALGLKPLLTFDVCLLYTSDAADDA